MVHQSSRMRRGAEGMLSPYVRDGEPIKPLGDGPEGQSCREENDVVEWRHQEDQGGLRKLRILRVVGPVVLKGASLSQNSQRWVGLDQSYR